MWATILINRILKEIIKLYCVRYLINPGHFLLGKTFPGQTALTILALRWGIFDKNFKRNWKINQDFGGLTEFLNSKKKNCMSLIRFHAPTRILWKVVFITTCKICIHLKVQLYLISDCATHHYMHVDVEPHSTKVKSEKTRNLHNCNNVIEDYKFCSHAPINILYELQEALSLNSIVCE